MKLRTGLTFIALFIIGNIIAQDSKSLLWKISGNGISQPSYLFGTAHLLCDAKLDAKTKSAISSTKQLYLEVNIDDPQATIQMMSLTMMKGGKTLSSLLSKEDYALLNKAVKARTGAPLSTINTVKPMVLTSLFLPSLLNCAPQSMEQLILDEAKKHQHEVLGLETYAQQFAAIDAIPETVQLEELVKSVKNDFKEEKVVLEELFALYKAQDIEGLLSLSKQDPTTMGSDDALLKDRNKKWVPKISRVVQVKPTFFAVGAAHMAGPDGVIALLRDAGFTVTAE